MFLGVRAYFLLLNVSVVWSRAGREVKKVEARITAPPVWKRDDPIGGRTDFIGYTFGFDNTYTPYFCYGSVTSFSNFINCCTEGDCDFPIGCNGTAIVETIFESGTRSRTQTVPCNGPGPVACRSGYVYQNSGDTDALTSFHCGLPSIIVGGDGTFYRTLTANAPVWTTTPSDSYSPPSTVPSTTSPKSSTPKATKPTPTNSQPTETSDSSSSPSSDQTSSNSETQTSSHPSTSSPSTQSPQNSTTSPDTPSSSSSSSSTTTKLALGLGLGLGIPILLLALLIWLIPQPIQRLRSRLASPTTNVHPASLGPGEKPELGAEERAQLDGQPWILEMPPGEQRRGNVRVVSGGVGVPGELEGWRGEGRRELPG